MSQVNLPMLQVYEAYTMDIGRVIARIDYDSMDKICVCPGDVIEIRGKRRTVAKCLPLYSSDECKNIIRLNGLVRNNAGISISHRVVVRKIKAVPAQTVFISAIKIHIPVNVMEFPKELDGAPFANQDLMVIDLARYGGYQIYRVVGHEPENEEVLEVDPKTKFVITGEIAN